MAGPLTDRRFSSFPELSEDTVVYLRDAGFHYATPVQAAVLPIFCGNKDVVVDACTGSGKTLAFLLPVLEKLRKLDRAFTKFDVAFVVISPTRELALQTFRVAQPLFEKLTQLCVRRLVGGSEVGTDLKEISSDGGNVIIGTPGRINDIMKKKTSLNFRTLEVLVLDEADRLLDLGFEAQLLEIIHALPKQRRTGLFSATQAEACETLVKAGLRNPLRVNVTTTATGSAQKITDFAQKTPQSLSIFASIVPLDQKLNHLIQFIKDHLDRKIIVYGLTCACVEYWFYILRKVESLRGARIRALHGKMQQSGREKAVSSFTKDISGVLLATDVAARGLDIPAVHWVIQLDAPQDPNVFIHRVGRAARMGRSGDALIYLTPDEASYVKFLQLRKVPITVQEPPDENADDCTQWQRQVSETEREAMLKGISAYTSYIRAYGNHHCPYIFDLKNLDLGQLAYLYGLLYLPGMKEIKVKEGVNFVPSKVDPNSVPFVDATREAERQKRWMLRQKEKNSLQNSKATNKKKGKKMQDSKSEVPDARPKKTKNPNKRDLEELEKDYKLYRLEKKGKLKRVEGDPVQDADMVLEDIGRHSEDSFPANEREEKIRQERQVVEKDEAFIHEKTRSQSQPERTEKNECNDALRKSLREKLEAMKCSRSRKKPSRRMQLRASHGRSRNHV